MKKLTKGTLVQIIDSAIPPQHYNEMRKMVTNHGHLWLIDEPINGNAADSSKWYWCKALSSGMVYDWCEDELTPFKEGDEDVE